MRSRSLGKLWAVLVGGLLCSGLAFTSGALACSNEALRVGASSELPDCRAYELVTPKDTNSASPLGAASETLTSFEALPSRFASPPAATSGDGFIFGILGTALPGTDGAGLTNAYMAERGGDGWNTTLLGPDGRQAAYAAAGGWSTDQAYQAIRVTSFEGRYSGTLALGGVATNYIRTPGGAFRLPGEGTLPAIPDEDGNPNGRADELDPQIEWISPGAGHIIFSQNEDPVRLLAASPPQGVKALYELTQAGLRIVSVLPNGESAPGESFFEGASEDGSTVLFRSGGSLFARLDGSATAEVASGEVAGAGVSDNGDFAFFADGAAGTGNLYRYDTRSGVSTAISTSGDSRFVNVSPDASHVYFESPSLDGALGVPGAPNLYVWDGASTAYIATVTEADLLRELSPGGTVGGLTQWVDGSRSAPASKGDVVRDTSRVTFDGKVFVFESKASLAGFDAGGQTQIYRYDAEAAQLVCVSCHASGEAPDGGAALADYTFTAVGPNAVIRNLSSDGRTIFFQSDAPLLGRDKNGTTDVYEWREGTLSLISTGQSPQPSLLMGASADGNDVFFRTFEQLVPAPQEEVTQAIYDARVGGGFPPASASGPSSCAPEDCEGETVMETAAGDPATALLGRRPHHRRKRCDRRRPHAGKRAARCGKRKHDRKRHHRARFPRG